MSNTCPSSSHQLVAATIAFQRARRKFPKNLGLRSRSGYFNNESKETSPENLKSGASWRKQIRNAKANNSQSHKTWKDDNRKATHGLLNKDLKFRPETSCGFCKCYSKRKNDATKEINPGKLDIGKSAGDVNDSAELKRNYGADAKLINDCAVKQNLENIKRDEKSSWIYKLNSPAITNNSTDNRSRAHEMAALSALSDIPVNSKNDPEAQYDLLTSYATPRLDQDDFTGRFYDWDNRNNPELYVKTIPRDYVASGGGCSCFEQSLEIASGQENCLRPSFVKAQQLKRICDKDFSKGRFGHAKRLNNSPEVSSLITTSLQEQNDEATPIEHKDSITILVEKFRAGAIIKNQNARNFGNIHDCCARAFNANCTVNCHGNKKSPGRKTNFENIRQGFQNIISKNPRTRANRMWRHTF